ncbi:predicted protein [Streptomyces iranensis]|uniref:Uncharacterized protein n=1 Tax=Streptomyces iranensis TaxID=576784 RepID=A0A060ZGE3_9ACTN|nr:predicted protein [Streptomyces iranensis]
MMPYMLTTTGASSRWRTYQPASRAGSRASPPSTMYRRASSEPSEGRS